MRVAAGDAPATRRADAERSAHALRRVAEDAGYAPIAREIDTLEQRTREGLFYVAVLGQFKRGKSTLINALLGQHVLPTGVAPVTSVVTLLRFGGEPRVLVHHRRTPSEDVPLESLQEFVTETGNPGNARGVSVVEIHWPAPLLASGLCLVDTPGIGSSIDANARETHAFVPHLDAALVVLGVDPPVTAAEVELLRAVASTDPPLVIVINKADLQRPEDLGAGVEFTHGVLRDVLGGDSRLLCVSARAALERRSLADGRPDGAVPELCASLDALGRSSAAALAEGALVRGISRAREALTRTLELERRGLVEPLETLSELEDGVAALGARLSGFLNDFSYQLRGELDRFARELEWRRDAFIAGAEDDAPRLAEQALAAGDGSLAVTAGPGANAAAWAMLAARLHRWETELLAWVDARHQALTRRFTGEASQLAAWAREAAAGLVGDAPLPDAPAPRWAPSARYYVAPDVESLALDLSGLGRTLLRTLLPHVHAARLHRHLTHRVAAWARHNATRISSAICQATQDAGRLFESDVRGAIGELAALGRVALARARARRAEGEMAVASDVARLDSLLAACRDEA